MLSNIQRKALASELIDHNKHPYFPAILQAFIDKIITPHMVIIFWPFTITTVLTGASMELLALLFRHFQAILAPECFQSDENCQLLADMHAQAKEHYPYIFISPQRLDRIRERQKIGDWDTRSQVINNLDRNFRLLQSKVGIEECVIHDLRRSAITNWAKKIPIQVVQQLAGHEDISTTRKYYLAVRPEDLASANSFLNKVLAEVRTN